MAKAAEKKAKASPASADSDFDPSSYLRAPVLDAAQALGLIIALIAAALKGAPSAVQKAAKIMHVTAVELRRVWAISQTASGNGADTKAADLAIDNAWAALFARLDAYSWLPAARHPRAVDAAALRERIFPGGTAFLNYRYAEEWAESEKRLVQIDGEKLARDIEELAGPEFLPEVRRAHKAYGVALNITQAAPETAVAPSLIEPLRAAQRAISAYTLQWVAAVTDDPSLTPEAKKALRPIDDFRSAAARRSQSGTTASEADSSVSQAVTPATPVPPLPK